MTPWQNERWATAPANDGKNFAPAHRWAVVAARPLCYGLLSSWYEAYESPDLCPFVGLCAHLVRCEEAGHALKNSDATRYAALARSCIREAHELRKSVDELRNTLFASMSPCVLCGIEEQKLRLVQWQNGLYSVMCVSCGGGCSCHSTQADAIRAWNTRGFEDANDRIDAYELVINEDRQRIATLEAALKRQVDNVERWMETGVPADAEESRSIYEQMVSALREARGDA